MKENDEAGDVRKKEASPPPLASVREEVPQVVQLRAAREAGLRKKLKNERCCKKQRKGNVEQFVGPADQSQSSFDSFDSPPTFD